MKHIVHIGELLRDIEQTVREVGDAKMLAHCALQHTKRTGEDQVLATSLMGIYEASKARQQAARKALEQLLDVGMGHASAPALLAKFTLSIEQLRQLGSTTTSAAERFTK